MKSAVANDGPRMKRIRPAPQGRAYRYQRRIAHIELVLAERGKNGDVATVVGEEAAALLRPRPGDGHRSRRRAGKKRRRLRRISFETRERDASVEADTKEIE